MSEKAPNWEEINLSLLSNTPQDRIIRITFQVRTDESEHRENPVILQGIISKVYQDDRDYWWMDVHLERSVLITDIDLATQSLIAILKKSRQDSDSELPVEQGIIDSPTTDSTATFMLADVRAPVIGFDVDPPTVG